MSVIAEIGSAFISIVPSAVGFNRKLESDVGGGISGSGKKLGGVFGKAFILGGSVLAAAGIGPFLNDSIVEAREAQKVGALTANVIKTTGGAAKISAAQVGTLAMSISNKTAIDDEAIQSGANLLLTFNKVANAGKGQAAIFDRATAAAVDLSASGFGDINGASKQLGKALQDPIKGISALSRSGVAFTAEQQATIKSMVGANNVLGAQKIILAEVETQVKGSAAAQATAGEKATVAFGNLKEQIGTALLPVIDRLATTFSTKIVPAISGFVTGIQTGAGAGGAFASVVKTIANNFGTIAPVLGVVVAGLAAYKLASTAVAVASAIQAAGTIAATGATFSLNAALRANPIGLVITGLTLLGVGLVIAYKKSATFRAIVNGAFAAVKAVVSSVVGFLSKYVPQAFSILVAGVKTYIAIYRAVVVGAFNVVRG
ncbi:MAG: hypothetical protein LH624_00105, partial [Cryobacterium sp.]|nr:hypothetical protein [Cryobacterium sp.]